MQDLAIFNQCIKDLSAGAEGVHGYGSEAVMAMLVTSSPSS